MDRNPVPDEERDPRINRDPEESPIEGTEQPRRVDDDEAGGEPVANLE